PAGAAPRLPGLGGGPRGILALQGRDLAVDPGRPSQPRPPRPRRAGPRGPPSPARDPERRRPPRAERVPARAPGRDPRHRLRGLVPELRPARAAGAGPGGVGGDETSAPLPLRRSLEAGHDLVRPEPGGRGP